MPTDSLILGIETSCDETAAAVVEGGRRVLSNVIASQHELHREYAGVVPEIASRAHLQRVMPVIERALREADRSFADIHAVAVGHRPGLIGSLLVGVAAAKALAWSLQLPLLGIDHIHAHLYAGLLDAGPCAFPALGLVVSGGHSSVFHLTDPLEIRLLGRTIDDAIGEAFDKCAAILEAGYPGGPAIDDLARHGDDRAYDFPVASLGGDRLDFSFSGLKTAVLYAVRGVPGGDPRGRPARSASDLSDQQKADFAASFQRAAIRAVMRNVERGLEQYPVSTLLAGGGVSANTRLRRELRELASTRGLDLRLPAMEYCVDNAAMIAGLASHRFDRNESDELTLAAAPTMTEDFHRQ